MKAQLIIGLAGALALAGCNNKSNTDENAGAPAATAPAAAPLPSDTPATATAPTTPQGFVDTAASSDMYEIAAAKLAQQSAGVSGQTKSFAAMMVKDHTQSSAALKAAVGKAGGGLSVPLAMKPEHQAQLDALKKAGDNFNALYGQQQVAAHQAALMLLQDQANSGTVAPLKDFAAKVVPVVQHHLDEAKKLS